MKFVMKFVMKLFAGWSVWAYVGLFAAVLAAVGGFAYHRGAISQAAEVGRLNGEITKLDADVAAAEAETATCNADITDANNRLKKVRDEAEERMREAAVAATKARAEAKKHERALAAIIAEGPSSSCDEEAERFREDLRKERQK